MIIIVLILVSKIGGVKCVLGLKLLQSKLKLDSASTTRAHTHILMSAAIAASAGSQFPLLPF